MSAYKFDGNKTLNLECPNCGQGVHQNSGGVANG